jgi:hypothetical protein
MLMIPSIQETESPTSLEISADGKTLLINVAAHVCSIFHALLIFVKEIHAWDVETKKLVQKYCGQRQSRFVIRACYGGAKQSFVISGSEGKVFMVYPLMHDRFTSICLA